jgi:hypothetical protein
MTAALTPEALSLVMLMLGFGGAGLSTCISPLPTEASASLAHIGAVENGHRRRFQRELPALPAAVASFASRPRSSNPHKRRLLGSGAPR